MKTLKMNSQTKTYLVPGYEYSDGENIPEVVKTGDYKDLKNKPDISDIYTIDQSVIMGSRNPVSGNAVYEGILSCAKKEDFDALFNEVKDIKETGTIGVEVKDYANNKPVKLSFSDNTIDSDNINYVACWVPEDDCYKIVSGNMTFATSADIVNVFESMP